MSQPLTLSPNDLRQYRCLTLANQLKVMLVQDPSVQKSACALTVKVGHFDDPWDREGMAHFLEHMLFLGTEAYPNAGEYQQFISENGGNHNAWTGPELTSYFFDVSDQAFTEALHRFSQFFTAPLFDAELVQKERQSVDSEYRMKLQDDVRRFYQVHKETINPEHPFAKFSVGNLTTLGDRDNTSVRDELIRFYQQHYSANLMTLVLVSQQPLDDSERLAQHYFADIPNLQLNKHYPEVALYRPQDLGIEIHMLPSKKQKQLSLTFALPDITPWYQHKPLIYISYLLGYEGEGSLLSLLKKQGLVSDLSAGGGTGGYNFKNYSISYQLTELGVAQRDQIIAFTFQYIALIKQQGIEDWRYAERQQLLERAFRYQEPSKALDLASQLTVNMHFYPEADLLYGDYRMDGLAHGVITQILALFTPDNARIALTAPELVCDQKAKWYDTPYCLFPISDERKQSWLEQPIDPALQLPAANPYLQGLLEPREQPDHNASPWPEKLTELSHLTLWYLKDQQHKVPKAHLFLALDNECSHQSPLNSAMTRLYISVLLDALAEHTYQAEVAGLAYNIYPHQGGFSLHLSGFTGGHEKLLSLLLTQAQLRQFTQARFAELKAEQIRSYQAVRTARPVQRLFGALTSTLQPRSHDPLDLASALESVTLAQLHQHIDRLFDHVSVEGFLYGDWLKEEAEQINQHLNGLLAKRSRRQPEVKRQLARLTEQQTLVQQVEHDHQDSGIVVYFQAPQADVYHSALFTLLTHSMSSGFFHELRTKQQLGYVVGNSYVPINRCPGLILYVQSPVAGPQPLLEAIDQFIADYSYALLQLSASQWQTSKNALCQQITEPDSNLKTTAQRLWVSIANKDYQFDQREQIAEQIRQFERADLIKYLTQNMRCSKPDRLVLYTLGGAHNELTLLQHEQRIDDPRLFKSQSELMAF